MAYLAIRQIKYVGEKYYYESPMFGDGLNILEAANGHGKSTLMNLIYYGLSGTIDEFEGRDNQKHEQIFYDKKNYVELKIEIDGNEYLMRRNIKHNHIAVFEKDGTSRVYAINRSKNEKTIFSDWMLEKLGINVFEIYQGAKSWKINFKDLFRLIYHDQELDPRRIYRRPETDSFITDSEVMRKIIFEILLGKNFATYYKALSDLREAERERSIAKSLLDEFITVEKHVRIQDEDLNLVFLRGKIDETEEQLAKLLANRKLLKKVRPGSENKLSQIEIIKSRLIENELEVSIFNKKENTLLDELIDLEGVKNKIVLETTQINKIVYTHQKLGLFTPDTCPYCLNKVERVENKCVCGSDVEEFAYEKFFYDSSEYIDILKSKQKSVDTIDLATNGVQEELSILKEQRNTLLGEIDKLKLEIREVLSSIEAGVDTESLDKYDDKILALREDLSRFNQQFELETKREKLQRELETISKKCERLRSTFRKLEIEVYENIEATVKDFSAYYDEAMRRTLSNCRSARINQDNYMPIIDEGLYKEASSSVPIRLNYFLSLLKLSLNKEGVLYPKFLMVDTPGTAGIDDKPLKNTISQISNLVGNSSAALMEGFQVLLTTGVGKYPEEYKPYVFASLSGGNKLLQKVE